MNSMERVTLALQHKEADHVPVYPLINSVSRKALGISYEEWTKDVNKCAEAIIKTTGEIRVLNPRETSRTSGHIEPARAVRAPGAWFPQTEAAECPVSA